MLVNITSLDTCIQQNSQVASAIHTLKNAKWYFNSWKDHPESNVYEKALRELNEAKNRVQSLLSDPELSEYNSERLLKLKVKI